MVMKVNVTKKKIIILAAIVLVYTLVGFFLCPVILQKTLTEKLTQQLGRKVSIQKVSVNPYTLSVTLRSFVIKEKNQDIFFSVDRLYGNLSTMSLLTFSVVVSDIQIDSPYIHIIRQSDKVFNFSDLPILAEKSSSEPVADETKDTAPMVAFVLKKAGITQGKVLITDDVVKTSHTIENIHAVLSFLSSRHSKRNEKTTVDMGFALNQIPVDIHIDAMPFSEDRFAHADIVTRNIDVLHYLPYVPVPQTLVIDDLDLNLGLSADYHNIDGKDSLVLKGKINALNADIKNTQKEALLKFSTVSSDIAPSDVLNRKLNISRFLITGLQLHLEKDKNGQINLLQHLPNSDAADTGQDSEKPQPADELQIPFDLTVNDFQIQEADIIFKDHSNQRPFETHILPLNIRLANIGAQKSVTGEFAVDFKTDQNEMISSAGHFGLFPLKLSGSLSLNDMAIHQYSPYFEKWISFKIEKGFSNLSCDFDVSQKEEKLAATVTNKELSIRDLRIIDPASKEQWANILNVTVKGSVFDLENKTIDSGIIMTEKGAVLIKRFENGRINFAGPSMSESSLEQSKSGQTTSKTEASSWKLSLNQIDIKGYDVKFNDLTNSDPVNIELSDIKLSAKDLKNFGKQKGSVLADMKWNSAGKIQVKGMVGLSDLSSDLDIHLEKIDIEAIQPYFTDAVKIVVTKGDINTKGKLALRLAQEQGQVNFSGDSSVTDFICLDKTTANDFFKCNSFYLSGIQASVMPVAVSAENISLTDFYSRIIITDSGVINIANIFKDETPGQIDQTPDKKSSDMVNTKSPDKTADLKDQILPEEAASMPRINISNVTLQGGNINFSDYNTKPNFTANMKEIAGSVTGLSSDPENRAELNLQGIHGQSSPLEIVGKINPLAQHKFFDIGISFRDIELVNFTPYSSKFLGYKIEKGILVLDLKYLIDGNILKSENKARFDNFTLGESVESKDATSLPVALAIALLKNRDGQINLDLPVTGQLDDPEFSIVGIIMKMIGHLILKVATSPFSIIGAMFGGGEELGYVDFEFGEELLDPSNFAKLDKLIQILEKKPSVKLEIQGSYDPDKDAQALRGKGYLDLLKAQKLKDVMKSGAGSGSMKTLVVEPGEMGKYINRAYAKADFPKPRDASGAQKDISVDEKAKLLMTNIKVSEDDLRLLAMKRSEKIKAYILSTEKLAKERIFLLEPKASESKEDMDFSRVNFLLK